MHAVQRSLQHRARGSWLAHRGVVRGREDVLPIRGKASCVAGCLVALEQPQDCPAAAVKDLHCRNIKNELSS